jgi:hypothetical protein
LPPLSPGRAPCAAGGQFDEPHRISLRHQNRERDIEKVTTDMPTIVNIRQDPFERTPGTRGETTNNMGGGYMNDFYAREFWRFVLV